MLIYNPAALAGEAPPASIFALTQSGWRARVTMAYPLFGTTATHVAALYALLGAERAEAYLTGLVENGLIVVDGNAMTRDLVVAGEAAVGFTDTDDAWVAIAAGKPVRMLFPDADGLGTLLIPNTLALIDGGPNPTAGRRLIDYLLSHEVERRLAFADSMQIPLREMVERPPHVPYLDAIRAMDVDYPRHRRKPGAVGAVLPLLVPALTGRCYALPGWAHAAIWLVFGALVLLPPVWLAVDALGAGSAQGVELLTGDQWRLFGRSLSMAAGAASLALVLGVPYALLCERTDLPGRSLWMLAGLLPLLIPAFVHALTWARVLAPNRPVATWLQAQLGGWAPSIHSPAGAALVLALAHLPFVILLAQAGLRSVDRTLEEAAALRLAPRMVWWRVTLPLILPYLLAGGLFVLVFALADFAVADTLRLRVYPVEVFIELSALFDEAAALRLSLPLLAVMLLLVGLIGWLLRGRAFVSLGGGRAGHELLALGRRRWAALAFCALVIGAAVLLPLGVLLLDAGAPTNYWQALQVSAETILTGIALAVAAALSTTALALGVALSLRALGGGPARVGLDLLSQLPFALAPILLGIGLIKVWNHPATALALRQRRHADRRLSGAPGAVRGADTRRRPGAGGREPAGGRATGHGRLAAAVVGSAAAAAPGPGGDAAALLRAGPGRARPRSFDHAAGLTPDSDRDLQLPALRRRGAGRGAVPDS